MKQFILASGSPRRKEILSGLGVSFDVIKSTCSEYIENGTLPGEAVQSLAERKAANVIESLKINTETDIVLISADTVVSINNEILGKPKDEADAFVMLKKLSGKKHIVSTGMTVVFINKGIQKKVTDLTQSSILFKSLTDYEIENYIKTGEPMDKAGSYAIQGKGACFIEKLEGDFFSVMGLSVSSIYNIFKENNINIFN